VVTQSQREKEKAVERLPVRGPSWDRNSDPLIMSQVAWRRNIANVSHMLHISKEKACKYLIYRLLHFYFVAEGGLRLDFQFIIQ
jgi:hypothetical protein